MLAGEEKEITHLNIFSFFLLIELLSWGSSGHISFFLQSLNLIQAIGSLIYIILNLSCFRK